MNLNNLISREGRYEKLYRIVLENIPFSLLLIDPSLRVNSANRNFLVKARRTKGNTIGSLICDIFPESILEITQLEAKIREAFTTGIITPGGQMTYRAPGLKIRSYFYTVIPIHSDGQVEQVMLVMDDITEKLNLSAQMRLTERHLASVVESANDLVISTDPEGLITSWNKAAKGISGYQFDEISKHPMIDLFEKRAQDDLKNIINRLGQDGFSEQHELNLVTSSGSLIPIDWSFSLIKDDSINVIGMVAVGRDLSERRALERRLFQNEKLAALGVMAGGIAHELRNPLSVSFSAAQFLLDPKIKAEFQEECVHKILYGIERSSKIVENLLKFARPASADQLVLINLVALVKDTLGVLANQAKIQKISLIERYEDTEIQISGNVNLLQQVIMNLVLNAFQSTPDGGEVEVFVRKFNANALVQVFDVGPGILDANINRIFDPFFTTRPIGQGTGLGLSISDAIVKQHGGIITGENRKNSLGAMFTVQLPLASQLDA